MCQNCDIIEKTVDELALDKQVFGKSFVKHMTKFMKILNKYFKKRYEEGVEQIDKSHRIQKDLTEDILTQKGDRLDEVKADLEQEYIDFYTIGALVQEGLIQAELTVGIQLTIQDKLAKQYAEEKIATLIGNIDKLTKDEINSIINYSMENMLSQTEAIAMLTEKFEQFSSWRASLIARMEATTTYAFGTKTQFQQYQDYFGISGFKRTQAVLDGRTRKSHRNAEELGYVKATDAYPDLDNDMGISVYAAPFDFNCRCVTTYRITNPASGKIGF